MKHHRLSKVVLAMLMSAGLAACSGGKTADPEAAGSEISVLSREDGSGTRSAFVELLGIEEKQEDGSKVDLTTPDAAVTSSTAVMLTTVSSDPAAIGYVSLGSMNDSVKGVAIDGVKPTAANVENGTYKVCRPFNLVIKDNLSKEAEDFLAFILSDDGQAVVEEEGYIPVASAGAYSRSADSGKVTVSGSSSVSPLMEKLSEAYQKANPGITVEVQQSDSSSGIADAADGISDIGMSSRDLKEEEASLGIQPVVIAQDGIVIIVNENNPANGLSAETVKKIYTGEITTWDDAVQ